MSLLAVPKASELWSTPQEFFDGIDREFGFTIDVCADETSAKCPKFYTPEDDGLKQPWVGRVWCNPPYSEIPKWIERGHIAVTSGECDVAVFLLPSRTGVGWFHEFALRHEVRFIRGRLNFGGSTTNAPFDCCLVVMRSRAGSLCRHGRTLSSCEKCTEAA